MSVMPTWLRQLIEDYHAIGAEIDAARAAQAKQPAANVTIYGRPTGELQDPKDTATIQEWGRGTTG